MKRMKAFDFEVKKIQGPALLTCCFITDSNDSITFSGDSVQEIYEQCIKRFPNGLSTKAISFTGNDYIDAKRNLSELLNIGFKSGYFKKFPFKGNNET